MKYASLGNAGFKKYLSCDQGFLKEQKCPRGSIFYFALQCCVSISAFPCKNNCMKENWNLPKTKLGTNSHDYSYFVE